MTGKLTALHVQRAHKRGMLNDGAGLYLQIAKGGSKSWVLRFKLNGKTHHHGLGPLHTISLAQARDRAAEARRLLLDGLDPIAARRSARAAAKPTMTFGQCAEAYIRAHRAGWRNAKHSAQWASSLTTYANPFIGPLAVQAVDTAFVMRVLDPIWTKKPETASRVRGRIEAILDWAKVRGYRAGENPARWKGHLDHLLPARSKVRKVAHHPAIPYAEIAALIGDLRKREGVSARALEFLILTASRVSETLNARWGEVDLPRKIWTIPPERMKASKEHRVPLSDRAIAILDGMRPLQQGDFVFPGARRSRPVSSTSLRVTLRGVHRTDLTVHGFRSSFRDWCAEQTNFPADVAEAALAHAVADKVEAAYRRGDLFEKRARLMDAWAGYCSRPPAARGDLVRLHA